jgi:hypothetical protein
VLVPLSEVRPGDVMIVRAEEGLVTSEWVVERRMEMSATGRPSFISLTFRGIVGVTYTGVRHTSVEIRLRGS